MNWGANINVYGGVGGNEYSIDGSPNMGGGRNYVGNLPVPEQIEEFKVETSGFDASFGHSTGAGFVVMSKAGTNQFHGALRDSYRNARWSAMDFFQKQTYYQGIEQAQASGNSALAKQLQDTSPIMPGYNNQFAAALGGPVVLPKIYNGKNKLFFFFSVAGFRTVTQIYEKETVPTMAERQGDFSDLLAVGSQYQIYDPLTIRSDPSRPGHYVRTPFAGNIIPASRISNPAYQFYSKLLPAPNSPPANPKLEPLNNYTAAAEPGYWPYTNYT